MTTSGTAFAAGPRMREDREQPKPDAELERRPQGPWEIGAAHWNQRDHYTMGARYALGPRVHPRTGSYAYSRALLFREDRPEPRHYEREAWPWERYGFAPRVPRRGLLGRLRDRIRRVLGRAPQARASDARIFDDLVAAYEELGELDASGIQISVVAGEVTLGGTVPNREARRVAASVAADCAGVRVVHDRLRIEPYRSFAAQSATHMRSP
jgi:hypothetical protein